MLVRPMLLPLLLAYAAPSGRSQPEADQKAGLITEVIGGAAVLQAYIDRCRDLAPATDARNRQAYTEWKERNQGETLASSLATDGQFQTIFEQMRQLAIKEMSSKKDTEFAAPRFVTAPN